MRDVFRSLSGRLCIVIKLVLNPTFHTLSHNTPDTQLIATKPFRITPHQYHAHHKQNPRQVETSHEELINVHQNRAHEHVECFPANALFLSLQLINLYPILGFDANFWGYAAGHHCRWFCGLLEGCDRCLVSFPLVKFLTCLNPYVLNPTC